MAHFETRVPATAEGEKITPVHIEPFPSHPLRLDKPLSDSMTFIQEAVKERPLGWDGQEPMTYVNSLQYNRILARRAQRQSRGEEIPSTPWQVSNGERNRSRSLCAQMRARAEKGRFKCEKSRVAVVSAEDVAAMDTIRSSIDSFSGAGDKTSATAAAAGGGGGASARTGTASGITASAGARASAGANSSSSGTTASRTATGKGRAVTKRKSRVNPHFLNSGAPFDITSLDAPPAGSRTDKAPHGTATASKAAKAPIRPWNAPAPVPSPPPPPPVCSALQGIPYSMAELPAPPIVVDETGSNRRLEMRTGEEGAGGDSAHAHPAFTNNGTGCDGGGMHLAETVPVGPRGADPDARAVSVGDTAATVAAVGDRSDRPSRLGVAGRGDVAMADHGDEDVSEGDNDAEPLVPAWSGSGFSLFGTDSFTPLAPPPVPQS